MDQYLLRGLMLIRSLLAFIILSLSLEAKAHTLIVDGKKAGSTEIHMVYHHVAQAGYNSTGTYMIRFTTGEEISLGKRSHWERFRTVFVMDNDQIHP